MGLIFRNFSFFAGTLFGIYIAQNYYVPDVKNLVDQTLTKAKQLEERYRIVLNQVEARKVEKFEEKLGVKIKQVGPICKIRYAYFGEVVTRLPLVTFVM